MRARYIFKSTAVIPGAAGRAIHFPRRENVDDGRARPLCVSVYRDPGSAQRTHRCSDCMHLLQADDGGDGGGVA